MNSPEMTWRVRRIGHTLWSSVSSRTATPWTWIERVQRIAKPVEPIDDERGLTASTAPIAQDERAIGEVNGWLAMLRLDRAAAAAIAESD